MDKGTAMINSALAVLLDRMGGEMSYTQSEFAMILAKRGEYHIEGEVQRSGPGEPVIRVKLASSTSKGSMPIA